MNPICSKPLAVGEQVRVQLPTQAHLRSYESPGSRSSLRRMPLAVEQIYLRSISAGWFILSNLGIIGSIGSLLSQDMFMLEKLMHCIMTFERPPISLKSVKPSPSVDCTFPGLRGTRERSCSRYPLSWIMHFFRSFGPSFRHTVNNVGASINFCMI